MARKKTTLHPNAPLLHADHPRPRTRREFLQQGFISGSGLVMSGGIFSLFANPHEAQAALSADIIQLGVDNKCPVGLNPGGSVPFICFDLAGGANMVGSNVLVGTNDSPGPLTSFDNISAAGYSKMGIPGDMLPNSSTGNFVNTEFGLPFHSDSGFLRGMLAKATTAKVNVEGVVLPARSGNDTANNPHNPMYGIAKYALFNNNDNPIADVTTLIGSQNSDSGGRSMAPGALIDLSIRPTKVDRPSDVTGLVDTGSLSSILSSSDDVVAVMESIVRLSDKKMALSDINANAVMKELVNCGYINAADIANNADKFLNIDPDDRNSDGKIVGANGIFSVAEFDTSRDRNEFRKTASVMKMVIDGHAGAGTIAMGGFDYHTGNRSTGELRDLRAGKCIGAVLEYAALQGKEVMIYVFSDGSLASNGTVDNSTDGRGKGVWTGDNSSTAASFFLHYNPTARKVALRQQIGRFSTGGSVVVGSSPASNNVNLLVNTVILNYMLLNGKTQQDFATLFPNNGLGNLAAVSAY